MCMMASKCLGRPVSSLIGSTSLSMSDLELGVGRNGFSGLSSGGGSLPNGFDFGSGFNSALSPITPPRTMGSNGFDVSTDQAVFIQLAVNAMNELVKLAQVGSPMWLNSSNRSGETLNIEEYRRTFTPCIGMKPTDFSTQATRASGTVVINSTPLLEILMDSNRSAELFPSIIGRAATIDIISSGMGGRNGVLQLMQAQFQVLSPLVPVRQVKFLRYCEQQAEGIWAVVDVSIDADRAGGNGGCRRLPSGCLIQDMPNGHSKVIWVEHMEYDESDVHPYFHPLLKSGIGFGAQRWVTNLERQCEFLAFLMSSTSPGRDLSVRCNEQPPPIQIMRMFQRQQGSKLKRKQWMQLRRLRRIQSHGQVGLRCCKEVERYGLRCCFGLVLVFRPKISLLVTIILNFDVLINGGTNQINVFNDGTTIDV